jgi:hypothetical protein
MAFWNAFCMTDVLISFDTHTFALASTKADSIDGVATLEKAPFADKEDFTFSSCGGSFSCAEHLSPKDKLVAAADFLCGRLVLSGKPTDCDISLGTYARSLAFASADDASAILDAFDVELSYVAA